MPSDVREMKERGDDDLGEEEVLHPSWRKPGFGIQLEVHTRDISLNRAIVTQSKVKIIAKDEDHGPFLPSTYPGAELVLGNPWTTRDDVNDTATSSTINVDARGGAKVDTEEKEFAKGNGGLARPAGTIPYVEPEAVPDGKNEGDTKEDEKTSQAEGKRSQDDRDDYRGSAYSERKSSGDAKPTFDTKFDAKGDKS